MQTIQVTSVHILYNILVNYVKSLYFRHNYSYIFPEWLKVKQYYNKIGSSTVIMQNFVSPLPNILRRLRRCKSNVFLEDLTDSAGLEVVDQMHPKINTFMLA